jgi:hypothetical protein
MKKFTAVLLVTLAAATVLRAETYQGLVVDKGGTAVIAKPSNPNDTIVNIMFSISGEALPYAGKIVEITGTLHPEKSFPTLQSIQSIKEIPAP